MVLHNYMMHMLEEYEKETESIMISIAQHSSTLHNHQNHQNNGQNGHTLNTVKTTRKTSLTISNKEEYDVAEIEECSHDYSDLEESVLRKNGIIGKKRLA